MDKPRSPEVETFWESFRAARGVAQENYDEAFAWDEGEGDRTRQDWLALHVRYFAARATAESFTFDESMPAVFERFTLVWPPGDADPEEACE
jgi:hypothetical protein